MKAAFIERTGGPEMIRVGTLTDPGIGPRDVLVRVRACGLNPIDTYVRAGTVAMPLEFPHIVGCDLAGEVAAVGAEVATLRPGDRVWGSNQGILGRRGTFAELAGVDERWLYPTPANLTDRAVAAAALVGITAHLGLVRHAGLTRGETIFVSGASGGVGSMVVQIAKLLGARVIAAAGTADRCARLASYGADLVINRGESGVHEPLATRVRQAAPEGVDVYWESLREPDFDAAIEMMAERGRMVLMAGRDARPPFPVGPFYVKGCSLTGFVMFKAGWQEQAAAAVDLNRWMASGKLAAPIGRVMPLEATAEAHRLQEEATLRRSGELLGKIVIEP